MKSAMKKSVLTVIFTMLFTCLCGLNGPAMAAEGSDADLAQELSNPLAALITVPIQVNYDNNFGAGDDGRKLQINIQPVIPFELNDDWNLITRTIVPVVSQNDVPSGTGSKFGLGDINMSLFFSPRKPTSGGVTWGVGPVLLLPSATSKWLGGEKWGIGPAAVALTKKGPNTIGILANYVHSFAGENSRQDIRSTFIQPFFSYTTPEAITYSFQSETSYNHKTEKWSIPVNFAVSKMTRWGKLPVSLQGGIGYWLKSPDSGPEGFRFRFQINFVLPKP